MAKHHSTIKQPTPVQEEKFKALFREYFSSLCLFAYRYLADIELSKDAVHDIFIGIWESPEQLNSLQNEKGYLYTIVRNHCLDVLRKQNVRDKYSTNFQHTEKESEEFMEVEILREETYHRLDKAINQLPDRSKEILRLKMSGLKNQEIAEKMEISLNTVNTLKTNAYRMLRGLLKDKILIYILLCIKNLIKSPSTTPDASSK